MMGDVQGGALVETNWMLFIWLSLRFKFNEMTLKVILLCSALVSTAIITVVPAVVHPAAPRLDAPPQFEQEPKIGRLCTVLIPTR